MADTTALVTGASSGIGRAIAIALAQRGATLWLVGRNPDELEATAASSRVDSPHVEVRPMDLTDDAAVHDLAAEVTADGVLDVLVHSAGVIALGPMESSSLADFDAHRHANVRAAYGLTQACLPELRRAEGQVVFVNSSAALTRRGGVGQYAATPWPP